MNIQTKIKADDAYHADFTAWLLEQAQHLRAREADALDWDNLAEEIESMGLNHYRELGSRLQIILIHIIKLMLSQDDHPRAGWRVTIRTQRDEIDSLLKQSPSLRRHIPELSAELLDRARKRALAEIEEYEPDRIQEYRVNAGDLPPPSPEQLLDDEWFPESLAR